MNGLILNRLYKATFKQISFTVFIMVLLVISCNSKDSEWEVKDAFYNYKKELLSGNGKNAASYLDARTISYYSNMLSIVNYADSTFISKLSALDKLMALSTRSVASVKELDSLSGETFFAYAVKNGLIGKKSVENVFIGDVIINEDFAKGQYIKNGKITPLYYHFYLEEKQWKIDLTSTFILLSQIMQTSVKNSGQTEDEYLFDSIEKMTGKRPNHEVWKPLSDK